MCANLNQEVQTISTEKQIGINLEFFGISSGLDEIVQASSIRKHLTAAWGNKLHDNGKNEEIYFPKSIISFTDKTRYLFQISKGMTGDDYSGKPFAVNKKIKPEEYAIPFTRMIFVGDGCTDVPCFSLVKKYGGIPLAVYDKIRRERWVRAWKISEEDRVSHVASTDYRKNSDLYSLLVMAIERIADGIAIENRSMHVRLLIPNHNLYYVVKSSMESSGAKGSSRWSLIESNLSSGRSSCRFRVDVRSSKSFCAS